jgi:hypothetical protein
MVTHFYLSVSSGMQEDRECFSSLINCTVCVYSYTLQFNMDSEQVRVNDPMILVLE